MSDQPYEPRVLNGEQLPPADTLDGTDMPERGDPDRAGRLVAPGEGAHANLENEMLAADVGGDAGDASAEEAAMHWVDEP